MLIKKNHVDLLTIIFAIINCGSSEQIKIYIYVIFRDILPIAVGINLEKSTEATLFFNLQDFIPIF